MALRHSGVRSRQLFENLQDFLFLPIFFRLQQRPDSHHFAIEFCNPWNKEQISTKQISCSKSTIQGDFLNLTWCHGAIEKDGLWEGYSCREPGEQGDETLK
ncbi:hypothetical protein SAY86_016458 [Trapa natans]|uniref:Uncharacterized protein n=1 Tax=Trapa natans TaxID=22666 RepID=A0AAN7QZH1_TRANT|nr:hypothetical protein SAY86_016458 [Trapa natans]